MRSQLPGHFSLQRWQAGTEGLALWTSHCLCFDLAGREAVGGPEMRRLAAGTSELRKTAGPGTCLCEAHCGHLRDLSALRAQASQSGTTRLGSQRERNINGLGLNV